MKSLALLTVQIATLLFASAAFADAPSPAAASPLPTWVEASLTGGVPPLKDENHLVLTQNYIWCWNSDGQACSTPGAVFRCFWIPTEPGVCVCGENNAWWCG